MTTSEQLQERLDRLRVALRQYTPAAIDEPVLQAILDDWSPLPDIRTMLTEFTRLAASEPCDYDWPDPAKSGLCEALRLVDVALEFLTTRIVECE